MRTVSQSIIDDSDVKTINIQHYDRQQAGEAARNLLDALKPTGTVGISISQSPKGVIEDVAFATTNSVYIVKASKSNRSFRFPLERLFKNLLAGSDAESIILAGFDLPRLALRLFGHFGYHVKGVDLSTICSPSGTEPWLPAKVASTKFTITDGFRINSLWHENGDGKEKLCLRAWLSARIAQECRYQIESTTKVNTRNVEKNTLQCLGELLKQTDLLSKALPKETASEYDDFLKDGDGNYMLTNSRFKTRVRPSSQSKVLVTDARGDQYEARATGAKGKTTQVRFGAGKQLTSSGSVKNICVIGQDDPTNAERARSELLLKVLQGDVCLTDYEFIRYVWFTTEEDRRLLMGKLRTKEKSHFCRNGVDDPFPERLNTSQKEVVKGMVSPFEPMVVVHGPPGTGKTTTISSAANYWSTHRQPVWIVGHSNVCVKNIAEKLSERRVPFKVIVSKEFYFEWHEHIYKEIVEDVIRGDEMPSDPVGMERLLEGVQVILSTIGMLSNPALERNGTFSLVPVERLVVDEASQINNFEYMTIFQKFPKLEKVCFFGDPKQLPPFGQESAPSLQCIFDIEHLQKESYFLDIQYRMPVPLGSFISKAVYGNRLKSEHKVTESSCISFVNARSGMEKKIGSSWMNEGEISGVVNLVRHYYQKEDFVIITPYDPQRSAIIKALKAEGLPADKVFNVDSFQGNEAEYVLISVVRTENVGFLKSLRRMNVMLTRCKKGMVIVSSQRFLETVGHRTLLGRLAQTWENRASNKGKTCWVTSNEVMNQAVHLPGALGRNGHILRPPANKLTQQIINSGSTPPQTGSFIPMSMLPLADTKTNKQKVKRKVNAVPKSSTKGTKPVVTEDTGSKRDKPKNKKKKGKAGKGKAATLTA